MEQAV